MIAYGNNLYKKLLIKVRLQLDEFSKEDLQALILEWASIDHPSTRQNFLNLLAREGNGPHTTIYAEVVMIEEIEALAERVEDSGYVDRYGWDHNLLEEREFGTNVGPRKWMICFSMLESY